MTRTTTELDTFGICNSKVTRVMQDLKYILALLQLPDWNWLVK